MRACGGQGIKGLPSGLSGDLNQLADPYVTFKLSKTTPPNGALGLQPQRSSFRKFTLRPKWLPPERFEFVVDPAAVAAGKWPKVLMEVRPYVWARVPRANTQRQTDTETALEARLEGACH